MKTTVLGSMVAGSMLLSCQGQIVVYSDNFNRAALNGGTYSYSTTVTAGDGGAGVQDSAYLRLTNDEGGGAQAAGRVYVTTPTSAYASPYNPQLNLNPGTLTWTFNMRYNRTTSPGGFNSARYGAACALAATSSDLMAASGYAVVYGNEGTPAPIRLVQFSGGLDLDSNLQAIASSEALDLGGINDYFSVRVTYEPSNDNWSLFVRDDGVSAWSDPASGVITQKGTAAVDGTFTGTTLSHSGVFWNYNTATGQELWVDNIQVTAVPEPRAYALMAGLGLLGFAGYRRWRHPARA